MGRALGVRFGGKERPLGQVRRCRGQQLALCDKMKGDDGKEAGPGFSGQVRCLRSCALRGLLTTPFLHAWGGTGRTVDMCGEVLTALGGCSSHWIVSTAVVLFSTQGF